MNIPMRIINGSETYCFIKKYSNFALYESEFGIKKCFDWHDLGMVKPVDVESSKLYKIPKI